MNYEKQQLPEEVENFDEEPDDENINRDVWKKFGRGNEIGNMLFSIYSAKDKPKINYPKPKGKKRPPPEVEKAMAKVDKKCPQRAEVDYPEISRGPRRKFHMVDFIPRKVHEAEILAELDKEKRKKAVAYGKRGVDRSKMIEELQEINRFGDKKHLDAALAKEKLIKARIAAGAGTYEIDEKTRLATKFGMKTAATKQDHFEMKYGGKQGPKIHKMSDVEHVQRQQDKDLHDLFD